jgi:DNA-binding beta-propeller fold protein YncE
MFALPQGKRQRSVAVIGIAGILACILAAAPAGAYTWAGTLTHTFNRPWGIAIHAGSVYVVDYGNNWVCKFTTGGTFVKHFSALAMGGLYEPTGVAVDSTGNVYVEDYGGYQMAKYNSDGGFLRSWGRYGIFEGAVGLAASGHRIYAVDQVLGNVQVFNPTGGLITKWGTPGTGAGDFENPVAVAVSSTGHVYVLDTERNLVNEYSTTGTFQRTWGSTGTGNSEFTSPLGIAVDGTDHVYVADSGNHRIEKFTSTGGFVTKWGTVGSGHGQFESPVALAVDPSNGYVYVTDETNANVQVFKP